MKILVQKTSKPLRNGKPNPKVPPTQWWEVLESLLKDHNVRILPDILTWEEMQEQLNWCDIWISVDTYWQHFAWHEGKKGIVIWGKSDPLIFGHDTNINLLKDRTNLRKHQFDIWEAEDYDPDVFVAPDEVVKYIYEKSDSSI